MRLFQQSQRDGKTENRGLEMDEQKEGIAVEYAGFWIRLAAYLIDWMVIWIIDAILGAIFWMLTFPIWAWSWVSDWGETAAPFWPINTPMLAIAAAYFICLWARRGETLGMMALKIRAVHADGTSLKWDWGAALLRFLGYIVCWITLGILFIWVAFDSRKQGIHDKIADTYVVKLPQKRAVSPQTGER